MRELWAGAAIALILLFIALAPFMFGEPTALLKSVYETTSLPPGM